MRWCLMVSRLRVCSIIMHPGVLALCASTRRSHGQGRFHGPVERTTHPSCPFMTKMHPVRLFYEMQISCLRSAMELHLAHRIQELYHAQ